MDPKKGNNSVEVKDSKVGTWFSVGMVGLVIVLTYFVLFGLYMDRV